MKEKLLFLSSHLPAPDASEAGQVCTFRNLEMLSNKYDVFLVAFRNSVSRQWSSKPAESLCVSTAFFDVTNASRVRSALSNMTIPIIAAARRNRNCDRYLGQLVKQHSFARVHLEGQQMAVYHNSYRHIQRKTLYAQDILAQTFKRKAAKYDFPRNLFYAVELGRLQKWERSVFQSMTELYVPSEKDVDLVRKIDAALALKTRAVQLFFKSYEARQSVPKGTPSLIFWGAYSRQENVDAVDFLIGEILPRLNTRGHDVKVIVAGANPPKSFERFDRKTIEVTGFIDDPGQTLRSATIALLPLRMGGGVKVKVLELLSAGVPVVTTPVGGEGIPCDALHGLVVTTGLSADCIADAAIAVLSKSHDQLTDMSSAAANWSRSYASSGNSNMLD